MLPTGKQKPERDAYSSEKLAAWPEAFEALRQGGSRLLTVHLMPQNLCNQRCSFCSYRLPDNKNAAEFDERAHIPRPLLTPLLADLAALDVKGIELTGGGEPLAYPYVDDLVDGFLRHGFAVGLVTNGTLLLRQLPELRRLGEQLRWVRVSIDASTPATYSAMRRVPESHFHRAWEGVELLAEHRADFHPDFRLGVGFVLCNENLSEAENCVRLAKQHGADNIRLSVTFSDQHQQFFHDPAAAEAVVRRSQALRGYNGPTFTVYNFMPRRWDEVVHPFQDYPRCLAKDTLCVIEGSCKVYTCCTFTGSDRGLYGTFSEHPGGFRGLWEENEGLRRAFDPRQACPVSCLYREKNLTMLAMIEQPAPAGFSGVHPEFM